MRQLLDHRRIRETLAVSADRICLGTFVDERMFTRSEEIAMSTSERSASGRTANSLTMNILSGCSK